MSKILLLLCDLKGTKSALTTYDSGGRADLEKRLEHFHDVFAATFLRLADRSRSLHAFTLSDSAVACWHDVMEGRRYALVFAEELWRDLTCDFLSFRIFLDIGDAVANVSSLASAVSRFPDRFSMCAPVSVATWSVWLAEASHLPNGIYLGEAIAELLDLDQAGFEAHSVSPFRYYRMK